MVGAVTDHAQHFVLVEGVVGFVQQATLLDDQLVEAQFHFGLLNDLLLHCVVGDEAEDTHLLRLTDTMRSILTS